MTTKIGINMQALRVELARLNMKQLQLARVLGHPASTLSTWLRGVAPLPQDLPTRIEQTLGLPPGTLAEDVADDGSR